MKTNLSGISLKVVPNIVGNLFCVIDEYETVYAENLTEPMAKIFAGSIDALEALKLAEERIVELSAWAKVPAEGQTLDDIRSAILKAN
jgi:hypothetical protein